jgi:ubiquinol-cytochrome c reductase cytochrome c1 subunit
MASRAALLTLVLLAMAPAVAGAAAGGAELMPADVDVGNDRARQRGAKYFVNYCLGCHSLKYGRYNRLAEDLGLTENQMVENLMFTGERPHDTITNPMPADRARQWFGIVPPDLSLTARARGEDWIYTFLQSFYADPTRPVGTNNRVLDGASMPHVLWELQGIQEARFSEEKGPGGGSHEVFEGFELVEPGALSPEEYDRVVRDITTFLSWAGEPMQLERERLGIRVLLFLVVFFVFSYMYYKEMWKDVK